MTTHLLDNIIELAQNDQNIALLWLYGSQARGTAGPASDIDLAVVYKDYIHNPLERRVRPELTAMDWQRALSLKEGDLSVIDLDIVPIPLAFTVISDNKLLVNKDDYLKMMKEQRIMSMWEDYQYQAKRYG